MSVLLWQGCFIACLGVCSVHFLETVDHDDTLAFVEHGTKSLGGCQIALQASPLSSIILDIVIPFIGKISLMAKTSFWQDAVVLKKYHYMADLGLLKMKKQ